MGSNRVASPITQHYLEDEVALLNSSLRVAGCINVAYFSWPASGPEGSDRDAELLGIAYQQEDTIALFVGNADWDRSGHLGLTLCHEIGHILMHVGHTAQYNWHDWQWEVFSVDGIEDLHIDRGLDGQWLDPEEENIDFWKHKTNLMRLQIGDFPYASIRAGDPYRSRLGHLTEGQIQAMRVAVRARYPQE